VWFSYSVGVHVYICGGVAHVCGCVCACGCVRVRVCACVCLASRANDQKESSNVKVLCLNVVGLVICGSCCPVVWVRVRGCVWGCVYVCVLHNEIKV
jgi:hypothetical protein